MKRSGKGGNVKLQGLVILISAAFMGAATLCCGAPGQPAPQPAPSNPITDIVKMSGAGVSKDVIRAYIAQSPPYTPTAQDVIALKNAGVTDDLTTELLKHAAESRAQAARDNTAAPNAAPAPTAAAPARTTYMNPESYDFWWYHYAYPRALAYSYDRLYPYNYGYPYLYPPGPYFSAGYPYSSFGAFATPGHSALHNRALQGFAR